jgi:repressor LexA
MKTNVYTDNCHKQASRWEGSEMELTAKQQSVLNFIQEYYSEHGIAPSVREVASALGKSAQAIQQHIESLRAKGFLHHQPQKFRSNLPSASKPFSRTQVTWVPVLGRVAAGAPILAEENIETTVPLSSDWAKDDRVFMLRVKGDSMLEAHIMPDDLAIIRQQPVAENGEVVVARVNGDEATLKKIYFEGSKILLKPENAAYRTMEYPAEAVEIVGKLIGVFRNYR